MNLSHGGNENTQAGVTELPQSGAERIALRTLRGCERSAERCLSCRAPEGVSAPGEGARQAAPLCDGLRGSQSLGWGWLGAVPGRGGWLRAWSCRRWPLGTREGAEAGAEVGSGGVGSRDILRGRPPGPREAPRGAAPGRAALGRSTQGARRLSPRRGWAEGAPWRCTAA